MALPNADTHYVPDELKEWAPWVLHGKEKLLCPTKYNNTESNICAWPGKIYLDLNDKGGQFTQRWTVYAKTWIELPGSGEVWPENISVNGKKTPVVLHNEVPGVELNEGEHDIKGVFVWSELPEMLRVSPENGLVGLKLSGNPIDFPVIDQDGRIWLQKQRGLQGQEDRTEIRAYRHVIDSIPMKIETSVDLVIAGKAREISIPNVLFPGFTPMEIVSPIPARLGTDGSLLLQARPGRWDIRFTMRSNGPVDTMGPLSTISSQEIWAFESQNDLRMVTLLGVTGVDPGQTTLPEDWRGFPAYIVNKGSTISFKVLRRGDPDPAPDQLNLKRIWWLDFDGKGFTVQDNITGTMSRQWFLCMNPPADLGHVSVDGSDVLITDQGKEKKAGVELRKGHINLQAESRYEKSIRRIPAAGWDHDMHSLEGILHLPPGWRILGVTGVDSMPGTWIERWTLLDFFMVLIIALAVYKLWGRFWGIAALITMVLTYHESGAPQFVWLQILAAGALLRLAGTGIVRRLIMAWALISVVTLICISIPFVVEQIRVGIYPQLEQRESFAYEEHAADVMKSQEMYNVPAPMSSMARKSRDEGKALTEQYAPIQADLNMTQDPNALIQTGPGLPDWKWNSYRMKWNGPVDKSQVVRLWLLSPGVNLFLAFVRVLLLVVLIYRVIPYQVIKDQILKPYVGAAVCLLFICRVFTGEAHAQSFPPADMLKELEQRLLKKEECYPSCAEIEQVDLTIRGNDISLRMVVNAAIRTAITLPSSDYLRSAYVVLDSKDGQPVVRDQNGVLWALVPQGVHEVVMKAKVPPADVYEISFPLRPHRGTYQAEGWDVAGIEKTGKVQGSVKLSRLQKGTKEQNSGGIMTLPPFLHLTKRIQLGLVWQVVNTLERESPLGSPVVVSMPLMAGESVTTPGIKVERNLAHIYMAADQTEVTWNSSLTVSGKLSLTSPQGVPWMEEWVLDVSPVWHCDATGIPPIHHKSDDGTWNPTWLPWPGESIQVSISRPSARPGKIMTIENVRLKDSAGSRMSSSVFTMKIRSSHGSQHKVTIPEKSVLDKVLIDNREQPIRQKTGEVVLPIKPGSQQIEIQWHEQKKIGLFTTTPRIVVGENAVNTHITENLPHDRWILFAGGPRLGPAVLVWSYILMVILLAVILGKTSITPLRTSDWFLLGLGLTQIPPILAIIVVGWLFALGIRKSQKMPEKWSGFDLIQASLVILSLVALSGIYLAIQQGLLGIPDMQVAGNGSSNFVLNWTQDRITGELPRPWVVTLPLMVYRGLMLLWALWIAYSLLKWLKWGWECFSTGGIWKKVPRPGRWAEKSVSEGGES